MWCSGSSQPPRCSSLFGALMNGIVTAVNDLPLETFARAARLANIWVAAASVGMTGLIGWRVSGKAAAVLGALLVAVVPLSVESTILVRNDAGMVLAVVAATYAALAYHDTGKLAWIAASGVFAGLAAGIKYTAVFTLVPVLIAALSVSPLQKQVRAAVLGVLAFGLTCRRLTSLHLGRLPELLEPGRRAGRLHRPWPPMVD